MLWLMWSLVRASILGHRRAHTHERETAELGFNQQPTPSRSNLGGRALKIKSPPPPLSLHDALELWAKVDPPHLSCFCHSDGKSIWCCWVCICCFIWTERFPGNRKRTKPLPGEATGSVGPCLYKITLCQEFHRVEVSTEQLRRKKITKLSVKSLRYI